MKSLTLLAMSLAGVAQSHYIFTTFSVGGSSSVRKNINNNSPITNLADPNLRCNAGGATGGSAQTVPVAAGSKVSFSADTPVYHQGPTSLYMTKVPSAAAADGSTPWFKIKDFGASTGAGQASFDMASKSDISILHQSRVSYQQTLASTKAPSLASSNLALHGTASCDRIQEADTLLSPDRELRCHYPELHRSRRLPDPHPADCDPQPGQPATVLHLVRAGQGHGRRQHRPTWCLDPRRVQGFRSGFDC